MDKDFNDIFGGVDWDKEYVSEEQAKEWFDSVKDSIDTDAVWSDMKTYIISGVDEPSHRSKFIDIKSEDNSGTISSELEYIDTKSDDELQIAKAAALVPSETDRDGEVIPPWLSVRTAHEFLANKNTDQIDEQHETPRFSKEAIQTRGEVVESHTLNEPKEYTTVHGETETYPEGTWMIEVKFTDDETWEKVKNGEIKGYSIHARSEKTEIQKNNDSDPCWENYEMVGIDENGDPICVPEEDAHETREYIKNNYKTQPDNKQSDDNIDSMGSDNTEDTETSDVKNMSTEELATAIANSTPATKEAAISFMEQEGEYGDDEDSEDEESENSEQESTDDDEESDQKMDMEKITDMMEEMLDRVEDLEEDVYDDDEDMEDEESENSEQESTDDDEESDQKSTDDVDRKVTNDSAPVQKDTDSSESSSSVFSDYWN